MGRRRTIKANEWGFFRYHSTWLLAMANDIFGSLPDDSLLDELEV